MGGWLAGWVGGGEARVCVVGGWADLGLAARERGPGGRVAAGGMHCRLQAGCCTAPPCCSKHTATAQPRTHHTPSGCHSLAHGLPENPVQRWQSLTSGRQSHTHQTQSISHLNSTPRPPLNSPSLLNPPLCRDGGLHLWAAVAGQLRRRPPAAAGGPPLLQAGVSGLTLEPLAEAEPAGVLAGGLAGGLAGVL